MSGEQVGEVQEDQEPGVGLHDPGEEAVLDFVHIGGRGLRGGRVADDGSFALFHWRGGSDTPQRLTRPTLGTLRPEALFGWPGGAQWQLLSDDGGVIEDGKLCKKLKTHKQSFRSLTSTR